METRALGERTAALETNEKNIFHQIDEIKREVHQLSHLTVLCEGISQKLSSFEEKLSDTERRLSCVERAPGEDLRYYKRSAVTYLLTAVLAAIAGAVSLVVGRL